MSFLVHLDSKYHAKFVFTEQQQSQKEQQQQECQGQQQPHQQSKQQRQRQLDWRKLLLREKEGYTYSVLQSDRSNLRIYTFTEPTAQE